MKKTDTYLTGLIQGFAGFRAAAYECGQCHNKIGHCFQNLIDHGQKPEFLFIGCADSRKPIESLYGLRHPGQALVHRNPGNMVPRNPADSPDVYLAINLALDAKAPHIVVTGHTQCGAMKLAVAPQADSHITALWRASRQSFVRLVRNNTADEAAVINVAQSVRNINRFLDEEAKRRGNDWQRPTVDGILFNLAEGNLYRVNPANQELSALTHYQMRPDRGNTPPACPPRPLGVTGYPPQYLEQQPPGG